MTSNDPIPDPTKITSEYAQPHYTFVSDAVFDELTQWLDSDVPKDSRLSDTITNVHKRISVIRKGTTLPFSGV